MFGLINANKPQHATSRHVVNQIEKLVRPAKVGHAGTLDPIATGVLLICIGPATRLTKYVQRLPKSYLADFRLGVSSDTDDVFGKLERANGQPVTRGQLESMLPEFTGQIMQRPPSFSAVKVAGQRAYRLARSGRTLQLDPRPVVVEQLRVIEFAYPEFQLAIRCSAGTYVRSIGRDIGLRLGSAAIMTSLQRTAVGSFTAENSVQIDTFDHQSLWTSLIDPVEAVGELQQVVLTKSQVGLLKDGYMIDAASLVLSESDAARHDDNTQLAAINESGGLVAVLQRRAGNKFSPKINFTHYYDER